ncbi:MAG: hypothetical protein JWO91_749 [Acidobacteriaceae bacterium]|jgi:hypothetical protein|nr:hypothetical protein [Acidobacteriaceae bacterium]
MKTINLSKSLLLGAALSLTTSVFAASKGSLQVLDQVTVNGQALKAGDYNLKWDGTGANVQLSILKGSKVVATTPAQVINLQSSPNNNAAVLKNNPDGSRTLSEIRFGGKKYALAIGGEATQTESSTSSK